MTFYNLKLDKEEFLRLLDKREIYNGFELVPKFKEGSSMNPGVPALLIKSISQFSEKSIDNLVIGDAIELYGYINKSFPEIIKYRKIGKSIHSPLQRFARKNNLSFFGISQYQLLEYYIKYYNHCEYQLSFLFPDNIDEQLSLPFPND